MSALDLNALCRKENATMRLKLVLVLSATLVIAVATAISNPGNVFTPRSARFSLDKLDKLEIGDSAEIAVGKLGEPIDIRPAAALGDCDRCSVYLFLGNAPKWVFLYEEAWILVDKQGAIASKVHISEP